MRFARTVGLATLSLAFAAADASAWTLKVVGPDGGAEPSAVVRAYDAEAPGTLRCGDSARLEAARCGCTPANLEALLAGPAGPPLLAEGRTSATGEVSLALGDAGAPVLVATSADGGLGATGHLDSLVDSTLALTPLVPVRVVVQATGGIDAGTVRAVAVALGTDEVAPLSRAPDGSWTTPRPLPGLRIVVAAAPGATPAWQPVTQQNASLFDLAKLRGGASPPPELHLQPHVPVRGRVVSNGTPVAGAVVTLEPDGCSRVTRTDAQGRFTFPLGPGEPYLAAVGAAKGRLQAYATTSAGVPLELALRPGADLRVKVVDASGRPVPGLTLEASFRPSDGQSTRHLRTRTASDGAGRLALEAGGTVAFNPPEGWAFAGSREVTVRAGATAQATLVVATPGVLDVEVLDREGRPLEGARVGLGFGDDLLAQLPDDLERSLKERTSTTDATGRVRIMNLLPGEYRVSSWDFAHGTGKAVGRVPGRVTVRLDESPVVRGRVEDASRQPVARARVSLRREAHTVTAQSGDDGTFRVAVEPGTWEVAATVPGGAEPEGRVVVEAAPRQVHAVTLRVTRPRPVRGVVVDAQGRPVAGAVVTSWPAGAADPMRRRRPRFRGYPGAEPELRSGPDGTFVLSAPGELDVSAQGPGVESDEPARSREGQVRVVVQPRPVVTGRVLGPDGAPLPSAYVGAARVGEDGSFRVTLYRGAPATLSVRAPGLPARTVQPKVPDEPAVVAVGDVRLEEGSALSGQVLDSAGAALKSTRVRATDLETGDVEHAPVRDDGSFLFAVLPRRPMKVLAEADRHAAAAATATPGGAPLKLVLRRLATLTVEVRDAKGGPVSGALLQLTGPPDPARDERAAARQLLTHSDGEVVFEDLAPGTWTLQHGPDPRARPGPAPVRLRPGESKRVSVRLPGAR